MPVSGPTNAEIMGSAMIGSPIPVTLFTIDPISTATPMTTTSQSCTDQITLRSSNDEIRFESDPDRSTNSKVSSDRSIEA